MSAATVPVTNFGGNLQFQPAAVLCPKSEAELLAAMHQYHGRSLRAVGRLHSWSEAALADEVLIDLRHLNQVRVDRDGDEVLATIGAGSQIKYILAELDRQGGYTIPSVGLISEQTIAGAISTSTHGSGKHSLSHYVAEIRLATYDPATGEPMVRVIRGGSELEAVRCSLGCLGIILSVKVPVRPQYFIEEHLRQYSALADVLAAEDEFPLQQFYLVPWRWTFLAQHRREVPGPRSLLAPLYRGYWFSIIDVGLHVLLQVLVKVVRSRALIRLFYRWLVLLFVVRGWRVVDRSQDQLIMEHELFRHIEIELFVVRSRLAEAVEFVRETIISFGGDEQAIQPATRTKLAELGLADELGIFAGTYTHHYAICIRQVLPDDTLISMTSGREEPSYAISLISYARPTERAGFFAFAEFLTRSMVQLFDARPHWGKVCPLTANEAERLYPRLAEFREICRRADPRGVMQNRWTRRVLFGQPPCDT